MNFTEVKKLVQLLQENGVTEIEISEGEGERKKTVRVSNFHNTAASGHYNIPSITNAHINKQLTAEQAATGGITADANPDPHSNKHSVKAPMVGTVYLSSTPGTEHFVEVGKHVKAGDTLCLIEAMKMFNRIEADKSGVISARLVDNAQPVEYNQPLFIIE
jgi:acetyl-CoA carboxylase biotin carboxyl carrier protein